MAQEEPAETREARAGLRDWDADEIVLEGLGAPITHRRVQLDVTSGAGRVELVGPA